MANPGEQALKDRFHCPKCRNKECVVHPVHLPESMLPIPTGRYLVTTCTLCGYTEFFDQAIFESLLKPETNRKNSAEEAPIEG